jgi:hypothetical protein
MASDLHHTEVASKARKDYKCMNLIKGDVIDYLEGYDMPIQIKAIHDIAYVVE